MDRQTIDRYIQNYISEVERSIQDPIVNRDLGKIPLDEVKAFFLLLPMLNDEEWSFELNISAIAAGAIHAAFDMHDRVDILDATSKEQQLMVLSGDHFSGIHYRLLSSLPDFKLITSMSEMIGLINETKTNLLMEGSSGTETIIDSIICIESGCIVEFHKRFGFSTYSNIAETALGLIWFSKKLTNDPSIELIWARNRVKRIEIENAISVLTSRLQEQIAEASFLTPFLKQEILRFATPLLGRPI
ncbi:heptaprenyl diphosphate synthase component 1 [Sporosarcina sp. ACRSL]|uniref:heptaprenyl diphosphate synthase component 1 n=1 Tax=Sporosarcina sp. ACRSL TaxID=2918215 RepID=UPI001EF44C4F|nr:heptaprenyl diphosphate synthase component 1 [Sporosarcina sp. ACRSL]MCG7343027.1 heptaprenyl diphosphate synthase component 1 [Sporosarcina sp. ACRSL]